MSYDLQAKIAKEIGAVEMCCASCGNTTILVTADVAGCLRKGWPKCCGQTMTLKTPEESDDQG